MNATIGAGFWPFSVILPIKLPKAAMSGRGYESKSEKREEKNTATTWRQVTTLEALHV